MQFVRDPALEKEIKKLVILLKLNYILPDKVIAFRSFGSRSRARARIWSFPRIWQLALAQPAHYCLEVLNEKFTKLSAADQTRVLIHELLHIPKNFSGALLPHRHRGGSVDRKSVEFLFRKLPDDYHSR